MLEELIKTLIHAGPLGIIIGLLILHVRELNKEIKELHEEAAKRAAEHTKAQSDEKDLRIEDAQASFVTISKLQTDYRDAIHKLADTAQVLARRDEDLDREARELVRSTLAGGRQPPPPRRGGPNG